MRIVVQKFGGTSLSTFESRKYVLRHIQQALSEQFQVVVVVSAMGRKGDPFATDTLLEAVADYNDVLPAREKDMLLCCGEVISAVTLCGLLQSEGIPSLVLNGAQAGIFTTDRFGDAQIVSVQPNRIVEQLNQHKVVIVTGFQGVTGQQDFTTLGRGGSDTTATSLGVALKAAMVDIFTDVNGVMTADPRMVPEARSIKQVTFTEICNMAHQGAKVIHPRAVELAMQANMPIRIRSTFSDGEGTFISAERQPVVPDRHVTGIAYMHPITQIRIENRKGQYDLQPVFKAMAQHNISVDFINVNASEIAYTVFASETDKALAVLHDLGYVPRILTDCAKVAVIGAGMNGVPGIMATIVECLVNDDIDILQSADSNATIWILVHSSDLNRALKVLHRTFQLEE